MLLTKECVRHILVSGYETICQEVFATWLKDLNLPVGETKEQKMIHLLTSGPHSMVKSCEAYDINGCTFYTKVKDTSSQCQNSGVRVDAEDSTGQKCLLWLH
jgi:hypothetical protein